MRVLTLKPRKVSGDILILFAILLLQVIGNQVAAGRSKTNHNSASDQAAAPFYQIKDGKTSAHRIQHQFNLDTDKHSPSSPNQESGQASPNGDFSGSSPPVESTSQQSIENNQDRVADTNIGNLGQHQSSNEGQVSGTLNEFGSPFMSNEMIVGSFDQLLGPMAMSDFQAPQTVANRDVGRPKFTDSTTATSTFSTTTKTNQKTGDSANEQVTTQTAYGANNQMPTSDTNDQLVGQIVTDNNQRQGKFQSSITNSNSISMSLDGMVLNSRPRSDSVSKSATIGKKSPGDNSSVNRSIDSSSSNAGKQSSSGTISPRTGELISFGGYGRQENMPMQNFQERARQPSRKVPYTISPFNSPATKGQRSKPKPSNQKLMPTEFTMNGDNDMSYLINQQNQPQIIMDQNPMFNFTGQQIALGFQPPSAETINQANGIAVHQQYDSQSVQGFDEEQQMNRNQINEPEQVNSTADGIRPIGNREIQTINQLSDNNNNGQQISSLNSTNQSDQLLPSKPLMNVVMRIVSSPDGKEQRLVMLARDRPDLESPVATGDQKLPSPTPASRTQTSQTTNGNRNLIQQTESSGSSDSSLVTGVANSWWPNQANNWAPVDQTQQVTTSAPSKTQVNTNSRISPGKTPVMNTLVTVSSLSPQVDSISTQGAVSAIDVTETSGQNATFKTENSRETTTASNVRSDSIKPTQKSPIDKSTGAKTQTAGSGKRVTGSGAKNSNKKKTSSSNGQGNGKTNKNSRSQANGQKKNSNSRSGKRIQNNAISNVEQQLQVLNSSDSQNQAGSSFNQVSSQQPLSSSSIGGATTATTDISSTTNNKATNGKTARRPTSTSTSSNGKDTSTLPSNISDSNSKSVTSVLSTTKAAAGESQATKRPLKSQSGSSLGVSTPATSRGQEQQQIGSNANLNNDSQSPAKRPQEQQSTSASLGRASESGSRLKSPVIGDSMLMLDPLTLDKQLDELERGNGQSLSQGESSNQDDLNASSLSPARQMEGLRASIPGEPQLDYPIYSSPPKTSFDCKAQSCPGGYYADMEAQCQVFHICQSDGRLDTFLCPNGTIFSQQHFVCVWWWQVDCQQSSSYYKLNDGIYCNAMFPSAGSSDSPNQFDTNKMSPDSNGTRTSIASGSRSDEMSTPVNLSASSEANSVDNMSNFLSADRSNNRINHQSSISSTNSSGENVKATTNGLTSAGVTTTTTGIITSSESDFLASGNQDGSGVSQSTSVSSSTDSIGEAELNQQQHQQYELLSRKA